MSRIAKYPSISLHLSYVVLYLIKERVPRITLFHFRNNNFLIRIGGGQFLSYCHGVRSVVPAMKLMSVDDSSIENNNYGSPHAKWLGPILSRGLIPRRSIKLSFVFSCNRLVQDKFHFHYDG